MSEYGVRWQEYDRDERLVLKQKLFKTGRARHKFMGKLKAKANFHRIYSTSEPKTALEESLELQELQVGNEEVSIIRGGVICPK